MPQNTAIHTFNNSMVLPLYSGGDVLVLPVRLKASATYAAGTVLGEITASPGTYAAYNNGLSDGTEVARCILKYACITDANNNITFGAQTASEHGETYLTAPAYFSGTFNAADLTGLDAAGVADLGVMLEGTYSGGVLRIG